MPRRQSNPYAPHDWAPHEKPALLGSPSTPLHSPAKRLAYGVVGLLVCLTGALGNAVVTANLQLLQGTFAAWSTCYEGNHLILPGRDGIKREPAGLLECLVLAFDTNSREDGWFWIKFDTGALLVLSHF